MSSADSTLGPAGSGSYTVELRPGGGAAGHAHSFLERVPALRRRSDRGVWFVKRARCDVRGALWHEHENRSQRSGPADKDSTRKRVRLRSLGAHTSLLRSDTQTERRWPVAGQWPLSFHALSTQTGRGPYDERDRGHSCGYSHAATTTLSIRPQLRYRGHGALLVLLPLPCAALVNLFLPDGHLRTHHRSAREMLSMERGAIDFVVAMRTCACVFARTCALSSSMANWTAASASLRCVLDIAISTLDSAVGTTPTRCETATCRSFQRWRAFWMMTRISRSAIGAYASYCRRAGEQSKYDEIIYRILHSCKSMRPYFVLAVGAHTHAPPGGQPAFPRSGRAWCR